EQTNKTGGSKVTLASELGKRLAFESGEQEAYLNVLRTADRLHADFVALFKSHGLTDAQYNVLRILRGHGERVPTRRVGRELVTREPDITRLVDRLEKADLVTRERCDQDRRVVWIEITADGLALLAKLDEPVSSLHHRQLGHLGSEKLATLSMLLCEARQPVE
ncbi:MAG: MarR family winged helix-turn-helix transcriptional regulator, partial [Phycisphaerae bacterium]